MGDEESQRFDSPKERFFASLRMTRKEILEITTMCGHGMTTPNLVKKCIEEVISGKMGPREAARLLARPCICGIFNPSRAEALLQRIALKYQ